MQRPPRAPSVLLAALALAACRAEPARSAGDGTPPTLADSPPLVLPVSWRTVTPFRFEALVLPWPPPETAEHGTLSANDLSGLARALTGEDELAVRAAVLLARSADPAAGRVLLARLEQRAPTEPPTGTRHGDAADVVAAAALWDWIVEPNQPERLARLAIGPDPHPDVEVRVECAASALHQGRDEVIPFLLRVLRSVTPEQERTGIDWPAKRTMTWSKSRAAEALSRRAGIKLEFRPDGAYAHQKKETHRLAELLDR